ncbi:hybrid sensor histidine kinase/response regulator [Pulveribacter suum]|uniref:Chemotaxis protein CheA n=1 Tax=Pulveribacter suum TaxID=2116657 RepID=A0A2P1NIY0_9BURK|nr:Hpt domain-containing protein [Pulveribacter suum]AVP56997.1 hybrid sensor histidine kinase/response regulator [Pulveribacter suum]
MSSTDVASAMGQEWTQGEQDLGPLAWVLDELRKSLEGSVKAMRRFVRDAEVARESDLASLDASALRIARQQLHQAGGALEMVGMGQPALIVRALENAVQRFVQRPELCSDEAAAVIERASFALIEYLEHVLAGKSVSPVALFPQYRQAQALAGAERVHPADLWPVERRFREPELQLGAEPLAYDTTSRARLDSAVLRIVKSGERQAAAELHAVSLGLAAAQTERHARSFWKICAGFFEALAQGVLQPDVYAKRVASRVLLQYASLAKGEPAINDRLVQDLLFFCAQAVPPQGAAMPALAAVRQAFGLSQHKAVDYEQARFGLHDPALLAQARKRIAAATETWSALAGGDRNKLKPAADQFSLVCDSLRKLHPDSEDLAQALTRAVDATTRTGEPPSAALAMEVATAVLYLQASFEELDTAREHMDQRADCLAQRLDGVIAGGEPQPLEPWMEELYRRVSDHQTMGSVVDELRASLADVENCMDQFFRDPGQTTVLGTVPAKLQQMRGVLSVLGLDQASLAVARMRDTAERLMTGAVAEADQAQTFEKLGSSLGALGFLIDMLSYQRAMARKLFVYDEELGELRILMGRARPAEAQEPAPAAPAYDAPSTPQTEPAAAALAVPDVDAAPAAPLRPEQVAAPAPAPAPAASAPVPAPAPVAPPAAATDEDSDDELLDIFLEEAREVVDTGFAAIDALHAAPGELSEQTTLRRAFHTLKGSSRMVGLAEFGEAAWAMEQALNAWLAEQKPMQPPLLQLSRQTLEAFGRWASDIGAGRADDWQAQPFRVAADAMRLDGTLVELALSPLPSPDLAAPAAGPAPQADPQAPAGVQDADEPQRAADALDTPQLAEPALAGAGAALDASDDLPLLDFDLSEPAPLELPVSTGQTEAEPLPDFADTSLDADQDAALAPPDLAEAEEIDFAFFEQALGAAEAPTLAPAELPPAPATPREDTFFLGAAELDAELMLEAGDEELLPAQDAAEARPHDPQPEPKPEPQAELQPEPELELEPEPEVAEAAAEPFLTAELPQEPTPLPEEEAPQDEVQPAPQERQPAELPVALEEETPAPAEAYAAGSDEAVKVIEHLRIGIPLYNVYLNEADEWSRRLVTALQEWSLELPHPLPDMAVALAHSLAGSSATVGFTALSELSRTLEHALEHLQLLPGGLPEHAQVANAAAEDIRRLLHQFAAGFLKEPNPQVLAQLGEILDIEVTSARAPLQAADGDLGPWTDELAREDIPALPPAAPPPSLAASVADARQAEREREIDAAIAHAVAAAVDIDDDIDALDIIDPDLFPIFEEEAVELLPRIGGALRQWAARPDNLGARSELLRALHTLKGSARLAGAMRLGEMSHRLESAVEQIDLEGVQSVHVEPLLAHLDALQADFDALRTIGAQPLTEAVAVAPVEAAPAQATTAEPAAATAAARQPLARPITAATPVRMGSNQTMRVRAQLLDRLVNQAGEVMIARSRLEVHMGQLRGSLGDLTGNLERLRQQLRDIEVQAETQMQSRLALSKDMAVGFDPLEFDRFTRVQELTRMMAESVNDVATVQRNMQRAMEGAEDDLIAQGRQARELQRDLLRTRMVEFDSISERLYAVVRQASKETGKQIKLDIAGGSIEMDRGVLDRMAPAFEHLLRNCVGHGIEGAEARVAAGKPAAGTITIGLGHEGNDVSVAFHDDGAGLDVERIRDKAVSQGLIEAGAQITPAEAANLIFMPGFSTAAEVTGLSGRGIGMDVLRSEVSALGGRIETETERGRGTTFRMVLPLTTAVTQVVMLRTGHLTFGVPANLVEIVRRSSGAEVDAAYASQTFEHGGEQLAFYWGGALLQSTRASAETAGRSRPVVVLRSASQRIAMHVDEVLGNQEVVVKNLGPQLSRLPGLAGMSVLASGAVVLIYNPVALATVYGEQLRAASEQALQPHDGGAAVPQAPLMAAAPQVPLVLVVDDSITVRRVTQRLLAREGYRVALAADGLQALERLQEERPAVVLSDIEMPRMDGFDLARNIRADEALRELPIIMITSRIAQKHREHAMELGVNHYLGKPYSDEELLGLVQRYAREAALVELAGG